MKKILFVPILTSFLYSADIALYTENFPPYQIYNNNKFSGIAIEIINEIQKKVDDKVDISITSWNDAYNKALNNKNCGVFSTGRTAEREKLFKWVGPIGKSRYIFFAHINSDLYIGNPTDASSKVKNILVGDNDVSYQTLNSFGITNLKSSKDNSGKENIQKVANSSKNDYLWASDYYSGMYKIKQYNYENQLKPVMFNRPFVATTMNIAFNINTDDKIIEKWSKALQEIVDNGTYDRILKKYE